MIICKNVQKHYDKNGKILGYTLEDKDGNKKTLSSQELKFLISENKIKVSNLKLTSDNRLISIETTEPTQECKEVIKQGSNRDQDGDIQEIDIINNINNSVNDSDNFDFSYTEGDEDKGNNEEYIFNSDEELRRMIANMFQ